MREEQNIPNVGNEKNESSGIGISRISYNKKTGEVKRDLFMVKINAEAGDIGAMCNLGSAYLVGTDVDRDPYEAAKWFLRAAAEGESVAMFNLGLMYAKGFGVERDFAKAAEWMRNALEAGDKDAEHPLKAFNGYAETMRKAQAGDPKEQAMLAATLMNLAESNTLKEAGPEQDWNDALYWAYKAARAGEPIAMNCLGILYSKGQGTALNFEEAFRWYLEAAERGLNIAMSNVAYYYIYGKGVDIDPDKAVEWFEKAIKCGWNDTNRDLQRTRKIAEIKHAAIAGSIDAQADYADELRGIGLFLEQSGGDPQKAYSESLVWAEKAVNANNPKALRVLAMAALFGRGVKKEPEKGISLLKKGCDVGDTDCMVTLAQAYLSGEEIQRDPDQARKLLARAKEGGNKNAEELLDKLSGKGLTPEEEMNLTIRAAVKALASGQTPEQVAERFGLNPPIVSLINVIRLLRGIKRDNENIDELIDQTTKMTVSLVLTRLNKGETPKRIASEFPIPENFISMIDQIDAFFR